MKRANIDIRQTKDENGVVVLQVSADFCINDCNCCQDSCPDIDEEEMYRTLAKLVAEEEKEVSQWYD